MKAQIFKFSLLALVTILFLSTSCNKDNDDSPDDLDVGTLVVKVDGETFESIAAVGTITVTLDTLQTFIISGLKNEGLTNITEMGLIFLHHTDETMTEKTYQFSDGDGSCFQPLGVCGGIDYTNANIFNPSESFNYESASLGGSATMTFTTLDYQTGGSAKGTFSGTLVDGNGNSVALTEGKFNVLVD
ncbi:MAG: hypothetical protein DWQ02_04845 [Bacteroidetes bacterium]|nr:MAG: hypothetical protein DWQ02_04845 [Bacteroidota bacterium]